MRRHLRSLALGMLAGIAAGNLGVAVYLLATANELFASESGLQAQSAGECQRVNVLRRQLDSNALADHQALTTFVRVVVHTPTPQSQKLSARQMQAKHRLLRVWRHSVAEIRYIPLTDCRQALRDPLGYQPPSPQSFGRTLPSFLRASRNSRAVGPRPTPTTSAPRTSPRSRRVRPPTARPAPRARQHTGRRRPQPTVTRPHPTTPTPQPTPRQPAPPVTPAPPSHPAPPPPQGPLGLPCVLNVLCH